MNMKMLWVVIIIILLFATLFLGGSSLFKARTNPLPNVSHRPQLLLFGMHVTPDPAENPIDPPERFAGYHTALDIETMDEEQAKEIQVTAVCDGTVLQSSSAEGYGGVLVQKCMIDEEEVTVVYGHLETQSLAKDETVLKKGDRVGVLAAANSADSGYTRKHLHLGIHKGPTIDIRGYVQNKEELDNFLDPKKVLGL